MRDNFEGLILAHTVVKDSDKYLTVLTAKYGKVSIYGHRVRSIRLGSLAYTMPFQYCRFEVDKRNSGMTLADGEVLYSFADLVDNLSTYSLGQYILDVARELTVENSDESEILRLTLNTLYLLQRKEKPLPLIKATFEFRVMALAGFMPDLYGCDFCGKEDGAMFFDIMNGRLICHDCQKIRNSEQVLTEELGTAIIVVQLTPSMLRGLRYVLSSKHNRVFSYSIAEDELSDYADVCEKYILNHLERGFNTLDFYHEVTSM